MPNRKKKTITNFFHENLYQNTIFIIDCHLSYPHTVLKPNGTHKGGTQSNGFKNCELFRTNNIATSWSLMKYEMCKRKGVLFSNIDFLG